MTKGRHSRLGDMSRSDIMAFLGYALKRKHHTLPFPVADRQVVSHLGPHRGTTPKAIWNDREKAKPATFRATAEPP